MGFWGELLPLGVALCLTVSGASAQCGEQQHKAFLDCVYPYLSSFVPLTMGSSCNRKLITAGLCTNFAIIVQCVNDINNSSTCMCDAVSPIREKINFACDLNDLREACTEAPNQETGIGRINGGHAQTVSHVGDAIQTTTSLSKEDGGINGGRAHVLGNGSIPQCEEQEHTDFLDCVLPYFSSFLPLTMGSSCNRKLITAGLCTNFATIVRCVNAINTSSPCRREAVTQIREQMNFACKLNDLQETCTEAPTLDTGNGEVTGGRAQTVSHVGDAIYTTASSSIGDGGIKGGSSQAFGYGFIPQCREEEHTAFLGCILPYGSSFLPLTMGSSCNRKLITAGLCTKFATIVRCVNDIKTSSACRRNAFILIREQMDFACKLNDLQETCTQAPTLDTGLGEALHSTTSSSKRGKQVTGSAVVSRAPPVLLMIYKIILLALLLQIY